MEQGMTWSEVAEKLEVDPTQLQLQVEDREVEPENGRFKIWTRARHVVRLLSPCSSLSL